MQETDAEKMIRTLENGDAQGFRVVRDRSKLPNSATARFKAGRQGNHYVSQTFHHYGVDYVLTRQALDMIRRKHELDSDALALKWLAIQYLDDTDWGLQDAQR